MSTAPLARAPQDPPRRTTDGAADARPIAATIARLVAQLELHHAGITVARKREGLRRALVPRAEDVETLRARLERLVDSWAGPNAATTDAGAFLAPVATAPDRPPARGDRLAPAPAAGEPALTLRIAELLALLLKNIEELTPQSDALTARIEQIGRVLTAPLDERKLDEAERCLRSLIVRQAALKKTLDETKRSIRELATLLTKSLSALVDHTGAYATKLDTIARRIARTEDLAQLSDLTRSLLLDTSRMHADLEGERATLVAAKARVESLEARTATLEKELDEAARLVRTDPLTRAFNRRGFAEAFDAEVACADGDAPPTIVLIDVDDFKRVNESYGHAVGDHVLCELVDVLKRCARPGDTVARHGGEEFALILPATGVAEARTLLDAMRLALRDRIGTYSTGRPTVTFSAGLAVLGAGEPLAEVLTRADHALRHAKRTGKDRVVVAGEAVGLEAA